MSIVIAIIIFSLIILFHELGHFLLAKANGIRVNEFCLGLGPTIVGFTKGETKYSIKLLPFGGACMMEGEDDDSSDERAFNKQSVWARISVVFAGPLFNFIMAFVLAVVVVAIAGFGKCQIGEVTQGYSASKAGLQKGDEIIKLSAYDKYFEDEHIFNVFDKEIVVVGNELAEALKKLPEHKRNVLLLSYFVGMSDKEIGGCLGAIQQTIFKRRISSLKQLKELLEKEGF